MMGCRNLPMAVAGLLLTPFAAQAQKRGRCGGSMCLEAEWRRRGRLHVLDNVSLYCHAAWVSRGRLITAIPEQLS